MTMPIRILAGPYDVETIAVGRAVRNRRRLVRAYGAGRWRKLKYYFPMALWLWLKYIGTRPMAWEDMNSKSSDYTKRHEP